MTHTYNTVHHPVPAATPLSAVTWAKPLKAANVTAQAATNAKGGSGGGGLQIKAEPGVFATTQGFRNMTGGRRASLVVDTAAAAALGGEGGEGGGRGSGRNSMSRDITTSDLQLFLQQSGAGSLTPITPKMQLDSLLVPGFQLPNSPSNPTYSSFNFGEVDQMLLG